MAVPNHFNVVRDVFNSYPGRWSLVNKASCGLFVEKVVPALHVVDRNWGYLSKANRPGGNQWNGHSVDGALYLSNTDGQSTHVDFIPGAEGPGAGIGWQPDIPRYSFRDWILPSELVIPARKAKLSASLFWLIRGIKEKREKLLRALQTLKEKCGAEVVRGFVILGHDPREGPDPWSRMGTRLDDPRLGEYISQATDLCFDQFGMQVHWTLAGRLYQLENTANQEFLISLFSNAIRGRLNKIALAEMANEYIVNGWESRIPELQVMARALRFRFPNLRIAISSPNSVMGGNATEEEVRAEIARMSISEVDAFTYHQTRPLPVWGPGANFDQGYIINGEPRGIGASAGGDVNSENIIGGDFEASSAAGEKIYTWHTVFGVFGGECDPAYANQNLFQSFEELPNFARVAHVLKNGFDGSVLPNPNPIPGGNTHMAKHPYPSDESTYWTPFEEEAARLYKKAGQDIPPEVFQAGRHMARTSWDFADSLTPEASKEKHLNELAAQLGVSRI